MALTEFPTAMYKRLLRAAKTIDRNKSPIAIQSILCGKPSVLYSYEEQRNIEIGNSSYSIFDKFVSIMNDGEYSTPFHIYPMSFYTLLRNTARLCSKNQSRFSSSDITKSKKKNKYSIFSHYCKDITLTQQDLLEIVTYFEALAAITEKYNESLEETKLNASSADSQQNTFQCDTIQWIEQHCTDDEWQKHIIDMLNGKKPNPDEKAIVLSKAKTSILDHLFPQKVTQNGATEIPILSPNDNESLEFDEDSTAAHKEALERQLNEERQKARLAKKKKAIPVLEYMPKTLQPNNGDVGSWRNTLLFQHPLATMSRYNNIAQTSVMDLTDPNRRIEPHVLLGVFSDSAHQKLSFTAKKNDCRRIALIVNGEQTVMNVEDLVQLRVNKEDEVEQKITTFHGSQTVPPLFNKNPVFVGGDDLSTIEVLTTNPYCKGVGLMNNKLFWNPDLNIAARIIESGYGNITQFRFYKGKMRWNNSLWSNIQERNLYGMVSTKKNSTASYQALSRLLWKYHSKQQAPIECDEDTNEDSLWCELLEHCCKTDTKDVESWLQIFAMVNEKHVDLRHEIYRLVQNHDKKISQQVQEWSQNQIMQA